MWKRTSRIFLLALAILIGGAGTGRAEGLNLDELKREIHDSCQESSIVNSQTRTLCRPLDTPSAGEWYGVNHYPTKDECVNLVTGKTDAAPEIMRLFRIPGVRKVYLPGLFSLAPSPAPAGSPLAAYRIGSEILLRQGQVLEGVPEASVKPELIVPLSFPFSSKCTYVGDEILREEMQSPTGDFHNNGGLETNHGRGLAPFVIGLLGDCSGLGSVRITSWIPGFGGNYGARLYDDTAADGSCPHLEQPGYPNLPHVMNKVKSDVFASPELIHVAPDIDFYKKLFTAETVAGVNGKPYLRLTAKPDGHVDPVRHVKLWGIDIGNKDVHAKISGIQLGSNSSTADSIIEDYHYIGDALDFGSRQGSAFAIAIDPPRNFSNPAQRIYMHRCRLEAPTVGVALDGSTDIVMDDFQITEPSWTAIIAHPSDGGIGLGVEIKNLTAIRHQKVRMHNMQLYGLISITRVPITVGAAYAAYGHEDWNRRPFGVTFAPNWETNHQGFVPRSPVTRVSITDSYIEGEDSHDEPGEPGEYLVYETMGPSYFGNYGKEYATAGSWLTIDNTTFVGGRTAIEAEKLIVRSNFCEEVYQSFKATNPDVSRVDYMSLDAPECNRHLYSSLGDVSGGFDPFLEWGMFTGQVRGLIAHDADRHNGLTQRYPYDSDVKKQPFLYHSDGDRFSQSYAPYWLQFATPEGLRRFDYVIRDYGARHSNLAVTRSRFLNQTGPSINLDRGRLYLQGNTFRGSKADTIVQLGGDGDYLGRSYSFIGANVVTDTAAPNFLTLTARNVPASNLTIRTQFLPSGMKKVNAVTPYAAMNFRWSYDPDPDGHYTYLYPGPDVRSGMYQPGDRVFYGTDVFERALPSGPSCVIACPASRPGCTRGAISIGSWRDLYNRGKYFMSGEQVWGGDGKIYQAQKEHAHSESSLDPEKAQDLWQLVSETTVLCVPSH